MKLECSSCGNHLPYAYQRTHFGKPYCTECCSQLDLNNPVSKICLVCEGTTPIECVKLARQGSEIVIVCIECFPDLRRTPATTKPYNACHNCGRLPTEVLDVEVNKGRLIYSVTTSYHGWYCKPCGLGLLNKLIRDHATQGWLSLDPKQLLWNAAVGTTKLVQEKLKFSKLSEPD